MSDLKKWIRKTRDASHSANFRRVSPHVQKDSSTAASANNFALRFYGHAAASQRDVLLSPVSIVSALSLGALGATKNSQTEQEFKNILPDPAVRVANVESDDTILSMASSVWVTFGVLSEFMDDASNTGAEVHDMPESVDNINDWVSSATRGRISSIMSEVPENLVCMIINAVFFRASWTTAFDKSETMPMSFDGLDNEVPMMCMTKKYFPFAIIKTESISAKMAELPYGSEEAFSAVVLVPDVQVSVDDIIAHLRDNPSSWFKWVSSMSFEKLDLLALPRFKLEYGVHSIKSVLNDLGLQSAFQPNYHAPPFARLTDNRSVYIDDVLHKATIECTEEGTVASAASGMLVSKGASTKSQCLIANKPFLFAIRERRSGLLLFIGRIDNPKPPTT